MSAPRRRGACPGLSVPMPTGDGLLARLMPTGPVRLDAFRALCASARRHGNGTIEVTARGSLQVRGLSEFLGAVVCRGGGQACDRSPGRRAGPCRSAGRSGRCAGRSRRHRGETPAGAAKLAVGAVAEGFRGGGWLRRPASRCGAGRYPVARDRTGIAAGISCRTGGRRCFCRLDRNRPAGIGRRCRHRLAWNYRGAWPGRARIRRASR